jgi:hypothetical protein
MALDSVHALNAEGGIWLHAQQAAEALGYTKKDRLRILQSRVRPEHRKPCHALEEGSTAEDTYLGFHTLCAKCPRAEMAQALQDAVTDAVRQQRKERQAEVRAEAQAAAVQEQAVTPQGWDARRSRLQAISHAFNFFGLDFHVQSRLTMQAQRYVSKLCMPSMPGKSSGSGGAPRRR